MIFAGEIVSPQNFLFDSALLRSRVTAMNPVAQTLSFDTVIQAIFNQLFGFGRTDKFGILGKLKAHSGVIEAQGRGSLHLHSLIWLDERVHVPRLREQLQEPALRQKIFDILEDSVKQDYVPMNERKWPYPAEVVPELAAIGIPAENISDDHVLESSTSKKKGRVHPACIPLVCESLNEDEFMEAINIKSDQMVELEQIHKHKDTCFKKSEHCRFRFHAQLFIQLPYQRIPFGLFCKEIMR